MLLTFMQSKLSEPGKSISLTKCPVFPTNACFHLCKGLLVTSRPTAHPRRGNLATVFPWLKGEEKANETPTGSDQSDSCPLHAKLQLDLVTHEIVLRSQLLFVPTHVVCDTRETSRARRSVSEPGTACEVLMTTDSA